MCGDSYDTSVEVVVGEAKTAFTILKSLLSDVAPFSKAAHEGSFEKATELTMTMPEVEPRVF